MTEKLSSPEQPPVDEKKLIVNAIAEIGNNGVVTNLPGLLGAALVERIDPEHLARYALAAQKLFIRSQMDRRGVVDSKMVHDDYPDLVRQAEVFRTLADKKE